MPPSFDPRDRTAVSGARLSPCPSGPGIWFDAAAADYAVNFFSWYCTFTAGAKGGEPFVLEQWQAWIVRQAFGWKKADGTRLYQRVFLWVPRGNGKTEVLAAIGLMSLMMFGGLGSQTFSIAATEEQARQVFNASTAMALQSPDLLPLIEPTKKSLYCAATDSVYRPLTAKPSGKHGLRCRVLLGDEMHEWPDGDLYDFVRRSMVKWNDPIEFNISTAGKPHGFGYQLWDMCEEIVSGILDDPTTLVIIYAADPETDDLHDPVVWRRVNPNLGVSINADVFANKVKIGLQLPAERVNVKRYHFNIWDGDEINRAIPPATWAINTSTTDRLHWKSFEERLRGRRCYAGLDLAATNDLNALVYLFPPEGDEDRITILPRFWWPRSAADEYRRKGRIPVEAWEASGAITITPGNVADHGAIEKQIHDDRERFLVERIAIDAFLAFPTMVALAESGVPIERVRWGLLTMGPIWKVLEKELLDGEYEHGNHPVLAWNAGGVALRAPDAAGNTMPDKRNSLTKIDGIAAMLLAKALGLQPVSQSYYLTEGLTIL